jgi:SAM-dependent methyltransferase
MKVAFALLLCSASEVTSACNASSVVRQVDICYALTDNTDAVWQRCSYGHGKQQHHSRESCVAEEGRCSKAGVCFFGRCFCAPGFSGLDCSEDRRSSLPPCNASDPAADECLRNPSYGSAVIPAARWQMGLSASMGASSKRKRAGRRGDRAAMHVRQFGGYKTLPGGSLGLLAEVGAGPFTQTYYLLEARPDIRADKITLVDPGIPNYLRSGVATYQSGTLRGIPVELLPVGAEQVPECYARRFDTVVMINVIEHTANAFASLHMAYRLLKPGGIFIFQERVIRYDFPGMLYHPVRLSLPFFDWFLQQEYEELFRFHGRTQEVRAKRRSHGIVAEVYYMGRKRK